MLVSLASTLLVATDLQLWSEKIPTLIPGSYIVVFIQQTIVSREAPNLTVIYLNTLLMWRLEIILDFEEMP